MGTTYVNDTGKPIEVSVTGIATGDSLYVDGQLIQSHTGSTQNNLVAVIPPGSTYYIIGAAGGNISAWFELRPGTAPPSNTNTNIGGDDNPCASVAGTGYVEWSDGNRSYELTCVDGVIVSYN